MAECKRWRRDPVCSLAVSAWLVAGCLACAGPADANMLARGAAAGGAGYAIHKHLPRLADLIPKTVKAVGNDDRAELGRIQLEVEKTPGLLIRDSSPVLAAGARGLAAAKRKVDRFVGNAKGAIADARAALVGPDGEGGILSGERLSLPKFRHRAPTAAAPRSTGWDPSPSPAGRSKPAGGSVWDAPAPSAAERRRQAWAEEQRRQDAQWARAEAIRKETEEREAEKVRRYARDYWLRQGHSEASLPDFDATIQPGSLAHDNFRRMMHQEGWTDSSGGAPDGYSEALAGLPDEQYGIVDDDYESALNAVEEMEAEQERQAEEERRRQEAAAARMRAEEEEREREEARAERRRQERAAAEWRRAEAERQRQLEMDRQEARIRRENQRQVMENIAQSLRALTEQRQDSGDAARYDDCPAPKVRTDDGRCWGTPCPDGTYGENATCGLR